MNDFDPGLGYFAIMNAFDPGLGYFIMMNAFDLFYGILQWWISLIKFILIINDEWF